jgi:hypothetical protein
LAAANEPTMVAAYFSPHWAAVVFVRRRSPDPPVRRPGWAGIDCYGIPFTRPWFSHPACRFSRIAPLWPSAADRGETHGSHPVVDPERARDQEPSSHSPGSKQGVSCSVFWLRVLASLACGAGLVVATAVFTPLGSGACGSIGYACEKSAAEGIFFGGVPTTIAISLWLVSWIARGSPVNGLPSTKILMLVVGRQYRPTHVGVSRTPHSMKN